MTDLEVSFASVCLDLDLTLNNLTNAERGVFKFDCSKSSKMAISKHRNTCFYGLLVQFQICRMNFKAFSFKVLYY